MKVPMSKYTHKIDNLVQNVVESINDTQMSRHKCCQLVLINMIHAGTYTEIKLNIYPSPFQKFKSKCDVIPKLYHVVHHVTSCV